MSLPNFPLKRLDVLAPELIFGINPEKEKTLGMGSGKVILLTSRGDADLLTVFYSLVVARSSLLVVPGRDRDAPVRVGLVYPSNFTRKSGMKKMISTLIRTTGVGARIIVDHVEVDGLDDVMASVDRIDGWDVYLNVYVGYYLTETKHRSDFLDRVDGKKDGKFIILNRFSGRTKSIESKVYCNIVVDAKKLPSYTYDFWDERANKRKEGRNVGWVALKRSNKTVVRYAVKYPCTFA